MRGSLNRFIFFVEIRQRWLAVQSQWDTLNFLFIRRSVEQALGPQQLIVQDNVNMLPGRLSCGFGSGSKVSISADHPILGDRVLLWQPGGEGKENDPRDAGRLSWDVISYYTGPRFNLNNYLYAQSAKGPFSQLFALDRWMNTTRWIRGSLPTWLNTPTSSAACWFRRKMRGSWETCE